jgi:hypothetical protein
MLLLTWRLLLGDRCASWTFPGARVGMRALTANRQRSAVPQSPVATNIHQSLDVHLDALPQVALNLTLRFENRPDAAQFVLIQILDASIKVDCSLGKYRARARTTDPVDVCQSNLGPLVRWKIDASYACHF